MKTIEEIHSRCIEDGGCLIWTGATNACGHPKIHNKSLRRVVWELTKSPLAKTELVTVTCENSMCLCHLAKTTKSEAAKRSNSRVDVIPKKRVKCAAGKRAQSVFMSMELAEEVRNTPEITGREWAKKIGCSAALISRIRLYRAWCPTNVASPFSGLFPGMAANDAERKRA